MNCEDVTPQLPLMLYGELSFEEEEGIQQHLDGCAACRAQLGRTRTLFERIDSAEPEVDTQLLMNCRRNLRSSIAVLADAPAKRAAWWNRLSWQSFLKPVGAVALVAIGFYGARFVPSETIATRVSNEPLASKVRYIEPSESGQVQIVLEETRQRVLSGDTEDEGIRKLLLAAARESQDPGVRVETMDLLKSHSQSADVRRALLHALRHDANAGVRLKALEGLRAFADDTDVRTVLSQVLLSDTNPGVRTQAIDLLVTKHEPSMVGVLQELMTREQNNYVRLKCQKALHEMNASVETF